MENIENTENKTPKEASQDEEEQAKIAATRDRLNRVLQGIKEWNATQFPEADMPGQLMKLEEELHEFHNGQGEEERLKELSDVVIVCAGLGRWQSLIGYHILSMVISGAHYTIVNKLLDDVEAKMAKNRARVWLKDGDGKYHHDVKLDEPANANGENTPA
jgi:hypothetical protein